MCAVLEECHTPRPYCVCGWHAQIARPLQKVMAANVDFARTPECQMLFGKMGTSLSTAPFLSSPDFMA